MKSRASLNLHTVLFGAAAAASLLVPARDAQAGALTNVSEAANYALVYSIALPNKAAFDVNAIPYSVDNHASIATGSFSRVAYYLELQKANGPLQYVYASMAAFTTNAGLIGIPNTASGAVFQTNVSNMNVFSNVGGVVTGTGITTGSLEFWHNDYGQTNATGVPNASSSTYDFGDQQFTTKDYGSFQVNNYGARQSVFAYNQWGGDDPTQFSDLGIGNQSSGSPDWTFAYNAGTYTVKNLEVYVLVDVPEPASAAILVTGMIAAALSRRRRT